MGVHIQVVRITDGNAKAVGWWYSCRYVAWWDSSRCEEDRKIASLHSDHWVMLPESGSIEITRDIRRPRDFVTFLFLAGGYAKGKNVGRWTSAIGEMMEDERLWFEFVW